jgi:hypothetical protein
VQLDFLAAFTGHAVDVGVLVERAAPQGATGEVDDVT